MIFALLAAVTAAWSLAVLRWSISRPHSRWQRRVLVLSAAGGIIALISITADFRSILLRARAPDSGVAISINDMGEWWRIVYARGERTFVTANEVHLPAGQLVAMRWNAQHSMVWRPHDFFPHDCGSFYFVAEKNGIDDLLLVRLLPPWRRHLRIIADPPPAFERWFAGEMAPAKSEAQDARLFVNSGCAYCHVVRGVSETPWKMAPELTHFGSRTTIAATNLPNARGFLSGWVVNSVALKHGSAMPQNRLEPRVLHQLVTFLESLR